MLTDDYRRVATAEGAKMGDRAIIHALWRRAENPVGINWPTDTTMCGSVDSLDAHNMGKHAFVNCMKCLNALKRERQARSAKAMTSRIERRRAEIEKAERQADHPDADLIERMQARAVTLRDEGYDGIAADLEIVAGRLAEHAQIPHDSSVQQPRDPALTYNGPERRLRPRQINATSPDEDA